MMLRLAGAVLVVAAGSGMGALLAGATVRRTRELRELSASVALLATEIGYGAVPLPAALRRAAQAGAAPDRLWGETARRLERTGGPVAPALTATVHGYFPASALAATDIEPLLALAGVLGCSDRRDQCRHLELCRRRLELAEAAAEALRARQERVYRYLGVLGGLAAAVLLA